MELSNKHRNLVLIGGVVAAMYFLAPWAIKTARELSAATQASIAKPSAATYAPIAPAPLPPRPAPVQPLSPEQALNAQASTMLGEWLGGGLIPAKGLCKMGLQIKPNPLQPGGYSGFSTTSCNPLFATVGRSRQEMSQKVITESTPVSLIMSGSAVKGEIHFQIDKAVASLDGCPITGFSATPFGEQVMAEWQNGTCQSSGQMVLNRVTNLR